MADSIPEQVAAGTPEVELQTKDSRPHNRPVSRLLAKVSKLSLEYADYHYEHCDWRRMAI